MIRGWDNENKTVTEQTRYCSQYTNLSSVADNRMNEEWYVLDSDTSFSERLTVSGNVHLILKDGFTLTCQKGIRVPEGAKLTVFGQTEDSGTLTATGDDYNAGIGSNDEDDDAEDRAGTVVIHGGTVTAKGGSDAAGIGGGQDSNGGRFVMYAGKITARGHNGSAGIGGGEKGNGGDVTIRDGTVGAYGREHGAGIGGRNGIRDDACLYRPDADKGGDAGVHLSL